MGNPWFRFRQFTVHQQKSAMKVTTDGCLFGAMQPQLGGGGEGKNILDIGTGTGLLSLITAQLNPLATITALEIEPEAAGEAAENVAGSPFGNRIKVLQQDVLAYEPSGSFHLILCNPPFHESQLSSPDKNRNIAHHSASLPLARVFTLAESWLAAEGIFSVLLPYYREQEALNLAAQQGLFCQRLVRVRQTASHGFFRSILFLAKQKTGNRLEEITIRLGNNAYSPAFQALLQPFYLNL